MSIFNRTRRPSIKESLQNFKVSTVSYEMLTKNPGSYAFFGPSFSGGTTVIILPYPKFDESGSPIGIENDRLDEDPEEFGNWIFFAKGVLRMGNNPLSFIFDEPTTGGYNSALHNPVNLLRKAVYTSMETEIKTPYGDSKSEDWESLVRTTTKNDGSLEYAKLPKLQYIYIMPVVVYKHKESDFPSLIERAYGEKPEDPLPYLVIGRYTMETGLYPALNDRDENTEELKHETFTGCKYVHFFNRKEGVCEAMRNELIAKQGKKKLKQNQTSTELSGFAVYISQTLHGLPYEEKPQRKYFEELAKSKVPPWEKVIKAYTVEEAAELIAERSGLPLGLLYYAWRDFPQYMSTYLKNKLKDAVTVLPEKSQTQAKSISADDDQSGKLHQLPSSKLSISVQQDESEEDDDEDISSLEQIAQSVADALISDDDDEESDDNKSNESKKLPTPKVGKMVKEDDLPF